jgi:hypothetical protein
MTTEAITPLRQRMIEDMNARKLCVGTQRGHIRSCKRFAAFLKRSTDTATLEVSAVSSCTCESFQRPVASALGKFCDGRRLKTFTEPDSCSAANSRVIR